MVGHSPESHRHTLDRFDMADKTDYNDLLRKVCMPECLLIVFDVNVVPRYQTALRMPSRRLGPLRDNIKPSSTF